MKKVIYEEVNPTLVENARTEKVLMDGVHRLYRIYPNEGYVLHNNVRDWTRIDPNTMEETFYRGYSRSGSSVPASYDFSENPNELYAVPADSVPAEQIF